MRAQGNLERARDMTPGIRLRSAYIHNHCIAAVKRGFGLICRHARNFCISLRQIGWRLGGNRFCHLRWNQDLGAVPESELKLARFVAIVHYRPVTQEGGSELRAKYILFFS